MASRRVVFPAPLGPMIPVSPAPSTSSVSSCCRKLSRRSRLICIRPSALVLSRPRAAGRGPAGRTPPGTPLGQRPAAEVLRSRRSGRVCRAAGRAHAGLPMALGPAEVEMEMQRRRFRSRGWPRGPARAPGAGACRAPPAGRSGPRSRRRTPAIRLAHPRVDGRPRRHRGASTGSRSMTAGASGTGRYSTPPPNRGPPAASLCPGPGSRAPPSVRPRDWDSRIPARRSTRPRAPPAWVTW